MVTGRPRGPLLLVLGEVDFKQPPLLTVSHISHTLFKCAQIFIHHWQPDKINNHTADQSLSV